MRLQKPGRSPLVTLTRGSAYIILSPHTSSVAESVRTHSKAHSCHTKEIHNSALAIQPLPEVTPPRDIRTETLPALTNIPLPEKDYDCSDRPCLSGHATETGRTKRPQLEGTPQGTAKFLRTPQVAHSFCLELQPRPSPSYRHR